MINFSEPPLPSELIEAMEAESLHVTDSKTGQIVQIGDMRAEFERLSLQTSRDVDAERAFIKSKIEMIRSDLYLSDADKKRAIAALQR